MEIALFGAAKLAWCPSCGRKVPSSGWNSAYKRRWEEFVGTRARTGVASGALKNAKGKHAVIVLVQRSGGRAEVRVGLDGRDLWSMELDTLNEAQGVASAFRQQLVDRGFR